MYTRSRLVGTFPRDLCTRYQATIRTTSTAMIVNPMTSHSGRSLLVFKLLELNNKSVPTIRAT